MWGILLSEHRLLSKFRALGVENSGWGWRVEPCGNESLRDEVWDDVKVLGFLC